MTSSADRLLATVEGVTDGAARTYVNLDNAATTPAATVVVAAVQALLAVYGSIHRGAGVKSVLSTAAYEATFRLIRDFVGASADDLVVVASNTTTVINRLAQSLEFQRGEVVLVSEMEHSSNVLPWRKHAEVHTFHSSPDGSIDLGALESALQEHSGRVRLVAVTGASNVTGYLTPLDAVATLAHRQGAELFVDAAQLAPHRQIRMRHGGDGVTDIDYLAVSGHKMYAPFGAGVLIGRAAAFAAEEPDLPGGGTVEMVTPDGALWAPLAARVAPGTPNVVGLVALAAAAQVIRNLGYDAIREHERELLATGLEVLSTIPGVRLHGQQAFRPGEDRLPLFPFTVDGHPHAKVAAVLGHEHGIAVRSGHLCQYEFMRRQLGISAAEQARVMADLQQGDRRSMYGMVRASCGLCTSRGDLEALGAALSDLVGHGPRLHYEHDAPTGMFLPLQAAQEPLPLPLELQFLNTAPSP